MHFGSLDLIPCPLGSSWIRGRSGHFCYFSQYGPGAVAVFPAQAAREQGSY